MIAWLDCETTGLIPEEGSLLEVALIVTDDNLEPLDSGVSFLVKPLDSSLEKMDDFVRNMHTKNGLLDELCNSSVLRRYEVEAKLIEYLEKHTLDPNDTLRMTLAMADLPESFDRPWAKVHMPNLAYVKLPMGGSSVHFDRAWMKIHMPNLEQRFHYRNVDSSTMYELVQRWAPDMVYPHKESSHRAMADILESIAELKWYRDNVFHIQHVETRPTAAAI